MSLKGCALSFILLSIVCMAFTNISEGIEDNPTKEQVEEAIKYGKVSPGKIFNTDYVKPATFGNWPSLGGGLVKSKLVRIAVVSAMKIRGKKMLTEEETQEMLESKELTISYRGGSDVYKIKLRQGANVIVPTTMVKPDLAGKDPAEHMVFITASFPYSRLDLSARTTIVIEKDFGTTKFEVNFANIP